MAGEHNSWGPWDFDTIGPVTIFLSRLFSLPVHAHEDVVSFSHFSITWENSRNAATCLLLFPSFSTATFLQPLSSLLPFYSPALYLDLDLSSAFLISAPCFLVSHYFSQWCLVLNHLIPEAIVLPSLLAYCRYSFWASLGQSAKATLLLKLEARQLH